MIDEVTLEELRSRAGFEKMDEAFCAALLNAIEAGQETAPTGVCTAPGTRWPTSCLGPTFSGTPGLSRAGANDGWLGSLSSTPQA
jgi:hypothetical protein